MTSSPRGEIGPGDESGTLFRIACPDCGERYDIDPADADSELECRCGCRFLLDESLDESRLSARVSSRPSVAPRLEGTGKMDEVDAHGKLPKRVLASLQSGWLWPAAVAGTLVIVFGLILALSSSRIRSGDKASDAGPTTTPSQANALVMDSLAIPETIVPPFSRSKKSQPSQNNSDQSVAQQTAISSGRPSDEQRAHVSVADDHDGAEQSASATLPTKKPRPIIEPKKPQRNFRRFTDALQAAQELYAKAVARRDAAHQSGTLDEKQVYRDQLAKTAGTLLAAMTLVDEKTDAAKLADAHYLLALIYMQTGHTYEAAVVGQYLAELADPKQVQTADAALLALSALTEIYQTTEPDDRSELFHRILLMSKLIESKWPDHAKVNDIRLNAAQLTLLHGGPRLAGDWYAKISASSSQFASSQLEAGRAYWRAYRLMKNDADVELLERAQRHLQAGIELLAAQQPKAPSAAYFAGKLDLAILHLQQQDYQKVVSIITDEPDSIIEMIHVKDESSPRGSGTESRGIALSVYEVLLRAYLGLGQLDRARQLLAIFQQSDETGRSTGFVVAVGQELLGMLESAQDEQVREDHRNCLTELLDDFVQRGAELNDASLFWAAETCVTLAERTNNVAEVAQLFQISASAYRRIIEHALVSQESTFSIKMRWAKCLWRAGDYAAAVNLFSELLSEKPRIYELQFEAAYALQLWGINTDEPSRLEEAIRGRMHEDQRPAIWGWNKIASVVQQRLPEKQTDPSYRELFLEARYNIALCRFHTARLLTLQTQQLQQLEKIDLEIGTLAKLYPGRDSQWWTRLDMIYQQSQRRQGKTAKTILN